MFTDVKAIAETLLYVQSTSSVAIKRGRLSSLSKHIESTFLLSCMIRFPAKAIHTPYKNVQTTNEDSWDIILGHFILWLLEEDTKFNAYYRSLPYEWQVILYATATQRILKSVGEKAVLEFLDELHSKETLVSMVTLPTIVSNEYLTQYIRKGFSGDISYPLKAYSLPKTFNAKNLKFLLSYGIKTISSTRKASSKSLVKKAFGEGRYGVIFTEHRLKGYKYRTTILPLFRGKIEDIIALYKGEGISDDISLLPALSFKGECLCDKDLRDLFVKSPKAKYMFLSKDGVHLLQLEEKLVDLPCVDYILDEEYTPIGVKVIYNEQYYDIRFNVVNSQLIHGIKGRYIRGNVKMIKDEVVSVSYNSIPPAWSKNHAECIVCGKVTRKHYKDGVCSTCYHRFQQNIENGGLDDVFYSRGDFSTSVNLVSKGTCYNIVGEKGVIRYILQSGQGVLNLGG